MSRIGKLAIKLGQGIKVAVDSSGLMKVEGPKGKMTYQIPVGVKAVADASEVKILCDGEATKQARALQGVTRTYVYNMIHGVSKGFSKELDIVGVGYRAQVKGQVLSMTLGYSHPIEYKLPEGIQAKVDNNTHVTLTGHDKVLLGMVAAKVRGFREPEPYQGKGVKYTSERIIRKQGKAAGAK